MGIKVKIRTVLTAALAIAAPISAQAHGPLPPLPLHHALPLAHQAFTALPLTHHLSAAALRLPGLSGASSAFLIRNHTIASNSFSSGFNSGFNSAVSTHIFQGQITNSQLIGTFYESFSGNSSFIKFPNYIFANGNNPLSLNGGVPTGQIAPSTLVNSIAFAPGAPTITTTVVHGIVTHGVPIGFHPSGSESAAQNQINALAKGAGALGLKNGTAFGNAQFNSPIVGGQLFGTDYYQPVHGVFTYNRNATFDFAFGNDSLNTGGSIGSIVLNTSAFRNYIQLANGKVITYTSGLLPSSNYFAGGHLDNAWIFSIGKNQFNFFNNFGSAPGSINFTTLPKPFLM